MLAILRSGLWVDFRYSADSVVLASTASDINVTFAEGADSLHLSKGATNATTGELGDAICFSDPCRCSIGAGLGDDSISLSVVSGSTISAGSGAGSITFAKGVSSAVYSNQGDDYITATGDATTTTLAGGKGAFPALVATLLAAKSLVTPAR